MIISPALQADFLKEEYVSRQVRVSIPERQAGPRPYCRICKREVSRWTWDRYADGSWGFFASCHGETTGGLLDATSPVQAMRLEVFCAEEPRMKDQQVWFVGWRGEELQPSQQYQQYAIQAGGF